MFNRRCYVGLVFGLFASSLLSTSMLCGLVHDGSAHDGSVWAGEYNRVLDIGDDAPVWKDLPTAEGTLHSSKQIQDAIAVVVVFTCNSCPYAVDAEDRLVALHKDYHEKGVELVAINVNKIAEDSLEAMKEKAETKGFQFAYLFDESQQIAKDFGAKYTPECFVINSQKTIAYMGSMDDSPDGKNVKRSYVREALDRCLSGEDSNAAEEKNVDEVAGEGDVVTETVPIGCRIRFDRQRRTRRDRS